MKNNSPSKTRSGQEPGLVSLEPLRPTLSACWTIGAFGRQRLYILSGRFGPENSFCSRYVVFPEALVASSLPAQELPPSRRDQPSSCRWLIRALQGKQDYTKGRLDILQTWLAETPDGAGLLEHSIALGAADDAEQAQRECVEHAIAAGHGRPPAEESEDAAEQAEEQAALRLAEEMTMAEEMAMAEQMAMAEEMAGAKGA